MTRPDSRSAQNTNPPAEPGFLARMALALTDWTERWVPDAFVFALVATLIVIVAGVAFTPSSLPQVIDAWGEGLWELIPFTLQMALIIITGHVLATSQPVGRVIRRVAAWPTTPRNAVALVAFFAMASSWFNWGFSLIFSAVLAREVARRVEGVDYRALAAASFLGLGSVWAQGLSGSAALQMATPGALQPQIREIVAHNGMIAGGIIPFSHTIFLWQSFVSVVIEIVVVTDRDVAGHAAGRARQDGARSRHRARQGGDRTAGASRETDSGPVARTFPDPQLADRPHRRNVSGSLLHAGRRAAERDQPEHRQPHLSAPRFSAPQDSGAPDARRAGRDAGGLGRHPPVPVLCRHRGHHHLHPPESTDRSCVRRDLSSAHTFPAIVAIYSAVLGVFVPSGGSKWVVEAPYVMAAAHELKVHLGWVVASYDLGEALANLVQPFWMLPILGLFQLRARDVMGYTFVVFLVLVPVVLLLVTILGATLSYPL